MKQFSLGLVLSAILLAHCAHAGHPVNKNLRMGFYDNAAGSPIVSLLNQAQKNLDIEIYEMDDPAVISAIRAALQRGVHVQIVKEPAPVGASCHVFESNSPNSSCADQQQLVQDVNQAGGSYVPFTKATLCPDSKACYEHGKMVIADHSVALISTGNFNSTNLCDLAASPKTCNRDYSFLTQDQDVLQALGQVIAKDSAGMSYDMAEILKGPVSSKLTVSPLSLAPLVAFIDSATQSIQVENQYLNEPTINSALINAANRGVRVSLTVASACSFGKPSASEIKKTTSTYSSFDNAGISSRMFTKRLLVDGVNGYLHAKTIIVDEKRAWLGSVNGSTTAASRNREFGIFFDTLSDLTDLSNIMTADHASNGSESWQDSLNCAEN